MGLCWMRSSGRRVSRRFSAGYVRWDWVLRVTWFRTSIDLEHVGRTEGWTTAENTVRVMYSCMEYLGILQEYLEYIPLYS